MKTMKTKRMTIMMSDVPEVFTQRWMIYEPRSLIPIPKYTRNEPRYHPATIAPLLVSSQAANSCAPAGSPSDCITRVPSTSSQAYSASPNSICIIASSICFAGSLAKIGNRSRGMGAFTFVSLAHCFISSSSCLLAAASAVRQISSGL